jgi:hypothetical protein
MECKSPQTCWGLGTVHLNSYHTIPEHLLNSYLVCVPLPVFLLNQQVLNSKKYENSSHIPSHSLPYCSATMVLCDSDPAGPLTAPGSHLSSTYGMLSVPHRAAIAHGSTESGEDLALPFPGAIKALESLLWETRDTPVSAMAPSWPHTFPTPASCQIWVIHSWWKSHPLPCPLFSHLWPLAAQAQQSHLSWGKGSRMSQVEKLR